jgi:hypothetical protein
MFTTGFNRCRAAPGRSEGSHPFLTASAETIAAAMRELPEIRRRNQDHVGRETWLFGRKIRATVRGNRGTDGVDLKRVAAVASAKARISACVPGIKADIAGMRCVDRFDAGAEVKMREMVNSARRSLVCRRPVRCFSTRGVGVASSAMRNHSRAVRQARQRLGFRFKINAGGGSSIIAAAPRHFL